MNPRSIPPFQLLQWRAAIKLEALGMHHSSGRSANAHAAKMLGLPLRSRREAVLAEIQMYLDALKQGRENDGNKTL